MLIYAEALDVAAEGAMWYARKIAPATISALHIPGHGSDTGIRPRWFDFTGGEPRLDVRPAGTDRVAAVLEEVQRLRAEPGDVVTVVMPEQYRRRSLLHAAKRPQFQLKLRLLVEPGVVVSDVTAVTAERRPEGRTPDRLLVRVLAGSIDDVTRAAVQYARMLAADDLRGLHFGPRDWSDDALGLEVDEVGEAGGFVESLLAYLRRLTADPSVAVNVVLPERVGAGVSRLSRRSLAIKRSLLFEPHVILTSVPHQALRPQGA